VETVRLDIGIASYGNMEKLKATMDSIVANSVTDWRCFIIDNPGPDPETRPMIEAYCEKDPRFIAVFMGFNAGYAGAVNKLFDLSCDANIAYCDNDIEINTHGWDLAMCRFLEDNPKCAQVFPGYGHYGFFNGVYHECLWNAGYCWMANKQAFIALLDKEHLTGGLGLYLPTIHWPMDKSLGHHEEVDLMIRLRLAGFNIGAMPDIHVSHHASATNSPESDKRIHVGVVRWMNKWNRYFNGDVLIYPNPDPDSGEGYDPRATRYTDWPPCALYLERFTLATFPDWNKSPRTVQVPGVGEMDAVEILKPKGCYVGRAI
jgi:glycosyltransferase involved in cell wall biosynthesis